MYKLPFNLLCASNPTKQIKEAIASNNQPIQQTNMADRDRGLSDVLSTATSLLTKTNPNPNPSPSPNPNHHGTPSHGHTKPSYGEIYSSAQTVLNVAKTKIHKTDDSSAELDKAKLAGATGTLIGAVSHYGKLDETSFGKYAQKAQGYLHSYEAKHGTQGHVSTSSHPDLGHGHGSPYQPTQSSPSAPQDYHEQAYPTPPPAGYPTIHGNQRDIGSESHEYVQGYPPAGYLNSEPTTHHNTSRPF